MVSNTFFSELKQYNTTNFRTLLKADLDSITPLIHKAFSSVLTRFFIYCEKHPDLTTSDCRILYYKLKLDMLSQYFAEYPEGDVSCLRSFQLELQSYVKRNNEEVD